MTSINTSNLDQAVVQFQSLPPEEQLATLGMMFKSIAGTIPVQAFGTGISDEVMPLLQQIQAQRQDEQLQTIGDFISNKADKDDEVALDPHPTQAMLELLPGNTQPALTRYQSLDANSRLAFWYQLGQQFNNDIPSDAADLSLSSEATELLTALRSLSAEQQAAFLNQIV